MKLDQFQPDVIGFRQRSLPAVIDDAFSAAKLSILKLPRSGSLSASADRDKQSRPSTRRASIPSSQQPSLLALESKQPQLCDDFIPRS
ncbi:hypothetical protein ElyMa_002000900 [Elysia marginata]|uniref:Uncharacterized protein n=1 Tax=Elysia marginata TaxID=1093978 RepID=A0AAV4F2A9_9GAST|nr:hypothetical protein ElyMa_002000900 [Elysia marginata]